MRTLATLAVALSVSAAAPAVADDNSITSALTGMNSNSVAIDQASNSAANANTAGDKKSSVNAADVPAARKGTGHSKAESGGHRR